MVRAREDRIDQQISELRDLAGLTGQNHSGSVHQIMMQPPDSGERAVHRTEKIAIGLACLLIGLSLGGWSLVSRMADDARDLRRQQQRYDDYQNMLWQRYPELRPENLKPKEDKK